MYRQVTIIYNDPQPLYEREEKAVLGVLEAVNAVHQAVEASGRRAVLLPLVPPIDKALEKLQSLKTEVVFNLFEGFSGRPETEASVAEQLDKLDIPYTGCRADVLRLALDKAGLKEMLKKDGIPTPDYQVLSPQNIREYRLGYPAIVKPRGEDASHGITAESVVHDLASLEKQVRKITDAYSSGTLVEQFLNGREYNATVMGDADVAVLPVSEIVYTLAPGLPRILTYEAKWEKESPYYTNTNAVCPAPVGKDELKNITDTARRAFDLVVKRGYARVDMRIDDKGTLYVMEVNPNPDIGPDAGVTRQAKTAGMAYNELIDRLINIALEKK